MDTAAIIAELEAERDRLNQAIVAMQDSRAATGRRGRRRLSAAARKRISEGMKQRWAKNFEHRPADWQRIFRLFHLG